MNGMIELLVTIAMTLHIWPATHMIYYRDMPVTVEIVKCNRSGCDVHVTGSPRRRIQILHKVSDG